MSTTNPFELRSKEEEFADWLLPPTYAHDAIVQLRKYNLPPLLFRLAVIGFLIWVISVNIVPSFDIAVTGSVGAMLLLAVSRHIPGTAEWTVVGVGLASITLTRSYAHADPEKSGAFYQGLHSVLCMGAIAIAEMIARSHYHTSLLPDDLWFSALPLGFTSVTGALLLSGKYTRLIDKMPPALVSMPVVQAVTYAWAAGAILPLRYNPLPELFPYENSIAAFFSIFLFTCAFHFRADLFGRAFRRENGKLFKVADVRSALDKIPVPPAGKKEWITRLLEHLAFALYAMPLVTTLAGVQLGMIPSSQINWWIWGSRAAAFLSMMLMWRVVRQMNHNLANALQKISGK